MKALTIPHSEKVISILEKEIRRTPEARYVHRLHAILLVAQGMSCRQAAKLLGDSPRSVAYWVRLFHKQGLAGLADSDRPGRPRRLTEDQMAEIAEAWRRSPGEHGLTGGHWDARMVSAFIREQFGVELGLRQCQRLGRQLGLKLSPSRPETDPPDLKKPSE